MTLTRLTNEPQDIRDVLPVYLLTDKSPQGNPDVRSWIYTFLFFFVEGKTNFGHYRFKNVGKNPLP